MRTRNNDYVKGSRRTIDLRPHTLQLKVLADQEGLYHTGLVQAAVIEARNAIECRLAQRRAGYVHKVDQDAREEEPKRTLRFRRRGGPCAR